MKDLLSRLEELLSQDILKCFADDACKRKKWWNCRFFPSEIEPHTSQVSDLFHISSGRFSLKNKKVAYFSEAPEIAWEEVTEDFRKDKDRTFGKRKPYYSGGPSPTPGKMGTNIGVRISSSRLLNLYFNSWLVKQIESDYPEIHEILFGEDEGGYESSRRIADLAEKLGFEGILYKSPRSFKENPWIDTNVVLFEGSKIEIIFPKPIIG